MTEIKVSVVMPIYNAEEFLNDTLRDVTGQTLKEIEIICVDDGSTDRSREIIREWGKKDARVQLVSQQNQYAGVARNHGFTKATGKYVIFWDADDMYHEKALEILYEQAEKEQTDICLCAAQRYDMEQNKFIPTKAYLNTDAFPDKQTFNKSDVPDYIFNLATNVPWNKLYRSDFIRGHRLQYQALRQANDTYFTMMALFFAERISYVEDVLVTYRVNNVHSLSGKASDTVLCPYESYIATLEELVKYPDYELVRESFLNKSLSGLFNALNIQRNYAGYELLYRTLVSEGFERLGLKDCKEEEIHIAWQYRDLQKMLHMTAGDFLVQKSMERRLNVVQTRADKERLQEENRELKKEIAQIRASRSFRLGKMLLSLPIKIKKMIKR